MGDKTYSGLLSTVVQKLGIDRTGKNTTNQSLRTTTFNAQVICFLLLFIHIVHFTIKDLLGLTPAQKRTISGHVSDKTAEIYTKQIVEDMAKLGGLMVALASGKTLPFPHKLLSKHNLLCRWRG